MLGCQQNAVGVQTDFGDTRPRPPGGPGGDPTTVDHEAVILALEPLVCLCGWESRAGEYRFTIPGQPLAQITPLFGRWSGLPSM